ncbi:hypothetical protein [Hydrogeniiclostridium mannosilyticum]|uniref:hypothetical protein n=1 Tax=Hydrogeniiclostridium mannosilyticum TaxID=2764322 RepID=UPI00399A2E16
MNKHGVNLGLLDFLLFKTGCMYLSELHRPENLLLVQSVVLRLNPDLFTLEEWNDAVRYITGQDVTFCSPQQAAQYLLFEKVS